MAITIRELIERPDLKTRLIAGAAGLDRPVTWAHVCELEDPTAWLSGGELVMTVGIGIPRDPAGQVAYVERLARAGLAGLMICEGMKAPPLAEAMLEAADRWAFPVMLTAYEVPFVAVSRVVADANLREEHLRLQQAVQVYEVARLVVHAELDDEELIARLERIAGATLMVLDPQLSQVLLPPSRRGENGFALLLQRVLERYPPGQLPAVLQLPDAKPGTIALAIPTRRSAFLVIAPRRERVQRDIVTLRHIATVLALALERQRAETERRHRFATELFAQIADQRVPPDLALDLLRREQGFPELPYAVAALAEGGLELAEFQDRLLSEGVPHAVLRRESVVYLLLPDDDRAWQSVRSCCVGSVGWSRPIGTLARVPEAMVEAQWALQHANGRIVRYGERPLGVEGWLLGVEGARELVGRVVGPLIDYDRRHGGNLLRSLETFLAENGSWSRTARTLGIHRQTLVYRLRRVEALTGLRVDRVSDLAMLWMAVQAARALGELPGCRGEEDASTARSAPGPASRAVS